MHAGRRCWIRSSSVGYTNETEVKQNIGAVSEPVESVQHHTRESKNKAERVQSHIEQQLSDFGKAYG